MLNYYYKESDGNLIYSLDMIRLRVEISKQRLEKFIADFIDDESHKISKAKLNQTGVLSWKHFMSCTYANGKTIKMGMHLNDCPKERKDQGFIEFNPNSFASAPEFWDDFKIIKSYFPYLEIVRFDLAIDFPIQRTDIAMVKDNRIYSCDRYSPANFTEYLGKRNNVGFVKLYNKQIESNLANPLTRLEVTCDMQKANIPKIIDLTNVPKSEKPLVKAILKNQMVTLALSDVSQYHRTKILKEIETNTVSFDMNCINKIKQQAKVLSYKESNNRSNL